MTKKDEKELDKTIELLENDDMAEQYDDDLICGITERLCEMSDKDYRKFERYIRCERRARKHLGSMSFYA